MTWNIWTYLGAIADIALQFATLLPICMNAYFPIIFFLIYLFIFFSGKIKQDYIPKICRAGIWLLVYKLFYTLKVALQQEGIWVQVSSHSPKTYI